MPSAVWEVRVRLADPGSIIARGRDEVAVDPGVQLGVGSAEPVDPDHVRVLLFATVVDTEQRERADEKQDREEDDRECVEASVEVRAARSRARLTTLAETSVRKIAIRTSSSFCVVLRDASKL